MTPPLEHGQTIEIPWAFREEQILSEVNRRASFLMWLAYAVYLAATGAAFLLFGDRPATALVVMMVQFLMVIWMGTRAMFANMSAMLRLTLAANQKMMPAFEKAARFADQVGAGTHPSIARAEERLAEAVASLKAIQEAIERTTKPLPEGARRGTKVPA